LELLRNKSTNFTGTKNSCDVDAYPGSVFEEHDTLSPPSSAKAKRQVTQIPKKTFASAGMFRGPKSSPMKWMAITVPNDALVKHRAATKYPSTKKTLPTPLMWNRYVHRIGPN